MKILFYTHNSYGHFVTTGTFAVIERMMNHCEVRVISAAPSNFSAHRNRKIPILPIGSSAEDYSDAIKAFSPDIVYLFANKKWPETARQLKYLAPRAKLILDIQTPLLADGQLRSEIQREGDRAVKMLDGLFTLAEYSADTWFTKTRITPFVYPLSINMKPLTHFTQRDLSTSSVNKWVFASVLHPKRKIDVLLEGFALFLKQVHVPVELDIFGAGPDSLRLQQIARNLGIDGSVRFRGLVSQETLYDAMQNYDAGIAWVPKELYDGSPSLKSLEYAATGLDVLATATEAHLKMREDGFRFKYCNDDAVGVATGMFELLEQSDRLDIATQNLEAVRSHLPQNVVHNFINPRLEEILSDERYSRASSLSNKLETAEPVTKLNAFEEHRVLRLMFFWKNLTNGKGGTERFSIELANDMASRGHTVYLAYSSKGGALTSYPVDSRIILLPFEDDHLLHQVMRGTDLDVFTLFYSNELHLRYGELAHHFGVPLVIQECTNPDRLRFTNWKQGRISRARAAWEREIASSGASRIRLTMPSYYNSFSKFQQNQIRSMPNGAPANYFRAKPYVTTNGRWRLLILNAFKDNKNLLEAVEAFALVAPHFPDWDMRVVGKKPNWREENPRKVAQILQESKLWQRFQIVGQSEYPEQEYGAAHIHLISSLGEGCPTVVLEAMSAGLPSVGFRECSGTNELIEHGRNGLLAEGEDRVLALADALASLMSDSDLRKSLGANAFEDSRKYDREEVFDKWERLLIEASEYRSDPDRLMREQQEIDSERALHARRMRSAGGRY